jgi:2'-5' RNA ligase
VRDLSEFLDPHRTAHTELRWTADSRWHVTLEFLGECGPHEVERQLARWEVRARRVEPLQLRLGGGGAFPHAWRAKVLWAGVDVDTETWRRLAGYQQEAHVTVARTRGWADVTGLVDSLSTYEGPSWTASEISLMESHLRGSGERGPRHEVVEAFPLGRGTAALPVDRTDA